MQKTVSVVRRRALIALGALPLARLAGAADQFDIDSKRTGGPYVPTPMVVVEEMLRMAKVGADDFVVDLGSGDGIIVLTAAQKYKARGYGVDIDPELIKLSNNEARKRGIGDRAAFYELDVARADLSKATVVTLYLLPGMMMDLRSKIYGELRPGTRVVSHDYSFGDWQADDQITWDVPEKEKVNGVGRATVYLWIIPAKVAGRWRLNLAGPVPEQYELTLKQTFQNLDGAASGGGAKGVKFTQSRLSGNEISFAIPAGGDRHLFKGRVAGDTMAGTVQMASGKGVVKWTAARMKG